MSTRTLLILNGPGLGDLSDRRQGGLTLASIHDACKAWCEQLDVGLDFVQTDDEKEMSRLIAADNFDALIINPRGYTQVAAIESEAFRSALESVSRLDKPVIEVHITNIFQRDDDILRPLDAQESGMGFICGLGTQGYLLAIAAATQQLNQTAERP